MGQMLLSGLKAFRRTFLNKVSRLSEKHATTDATAPSTSTPEAPPLPPSTGFIDQISTRHVQGWTIAPESPAQRLNVEAFLPETGEKLGHGTADQFHYGLSGIGDGSRRYGFWFHLTREITPAERETLRVRVPGQGDLARSPNLSSWQPLLHVAMDIVDNCNLRCPFCLYDYSAVRRTHVMTRDTLEAALRLLPYTKDGEFWFSCLHEPSLHPEFASFLDAIPPAFRKKVFFTTNLARRMPESYFRTLAQSSIDHINISMESRTPELYERMRKGARFPIFMENWDRLLAAFRDAGSTVALRYVIMAYKSNLHELPELSRYLLSEGRAAQVEIRYTYDVPFIDAAFRQQEFLEEAEWDWLQANLPVAEPGQILLARPPAPQNSAPADAQTETKAEAEAEAEAETASASALTIKPEETPQTVKKPEPRFIPGHYLAQLSWDGTLELKGISQASSGAALIEVPVVTKNIRDIPNIDSFLYELDCKSIQTSEAS
ncbi:MAG: radical SAM protein [Acetobacter persici]|uniref:radical SAM protein n=1 Tax=Acetobacter persici TaxID=1076596 RepID=UPI0039ED3EBB